MSIFDKKKIPYNTEKLRKIEEIKNNELNKECFDCGACYPEYISINNGVFICKDCINIHNKFPKQISNTLKNNLSSLNNKELEYMFLGGNQKLLEFVNYEYPQLHKFKVNILYQTKAMQYYRNYLNYLVNGGVKPIRPSEQINAYELIDLNEEFKKYEKISTKSNSKTFRDKKRNKSLTNLDSKNKKKDIDKQKTYKGTEKRRKKNLFNIDDEDSLKRHKSFYKEMNKIFSTCDDFGNISNIEENNCHKEIKIKKQNYKTKSEVIYNNENNNNNKNYNSNTANVEGKSNYQGQPVEHIYNNNYFTLSATKNIFMFTPNKESIIYKHRKINQNNNNNIAMNTVNEIYSKPKITNYINYNKQKITKNNLYDNKSKINSTNENNKDFNNNFKNTKTYEPRHKIDKINENIITKNKIEIAKNKNNDYSEKTDTNNIYDDNIEFEENDENKIFTKKRVSKLMKKDKLNDENNIIHKNFGKKGDNIFYRNEDRGNNMNIKDIYNKTELKESNINKIINEINKETDNNNSNNNKTYSDIKANAKKRKYVNTNINYNLNLNKKENSQRNPIRIEEGEDENISNDRQDIKHKKDEKNEIKNAAKYGAILNKKEENENNKINSSSSSFFSKIKNESSKMKLTLGRYELRRGYKGNISNNTDISKDKHFQYSQTSSSIFDKNLDTSKTHGDILDNNGAKKVSIRNKYKMRRIKEIV